MGRNGKNISMNSKTITSKGVVGLVGFLSVLILLHFSFDLFKFLPALRQYHLILYGDSLLQNGDWSFGVSTKNNGIGGYSTSDLLKVIERNVLRYRPKICVLNGGINDLRFGATPEEVFENYQVMVSKLKEHDIQVLLQETLPVATSNDAWNIELNAKVGELNLLLMNEYGDEFCMISKSLELAPSDYLSDGIHLSTKVYLKWNNYLRGKITYAVP